MTADANFDLHFYTYCYINTQS